METLQAGTTPEAAMISCYYSGHSPVERLAGPDGGSKNLQ